MQWLHFEACRGTPIDPLLIIWRKAKSELESDVSRPLIPNMMKWVEVGGGAYGWMKPCNQYLCEVEIYEIFWLQGTTKIDDHIVPQTTKFWLLIAFWDTFSRKFETFCLRCKCFLQDIEIQLSHSNSLWPYMQKNRYCSWIELHH